MERQRVKQEVSTASDQLKSFRWAVNENGRRLPYFDEDELFELIQPRQYLSHCPLIRGSLGPPSLVSWAVPILQAMQLINKLMIMHRVLGHMIGSTP